MMREWGRSQTANDRVHGDLWIACIEGPAIPDVPGRLVYRNVGNIVAPLDISCLAAMEMAIRKFDVRTIMVCGHDRCRCIEVERRSGISGQWLIRTERSEETLRRSDRRDAMQEKKRSVRNVIEQVWSVAGSSVVRGAAAEGKTIEIVGLVFDTQSEEFLTVIDLRP